MTWEELKKFHASHYHPSNARIFTYGNVSLENTLNFIHENALRQFNRIDPQTDVPKEKRLAKPKSVKVTAPSTLGSDPKRENAVAVCWLANDIAADDDAIFETFALRVLSSLLFAGPNSPFNPLLLESGLGHSFGPFCGYSPYSKEAAFGVSLVGVEDDNVSKIEGIVLNKLMELETQVSACTILEYPYSQSAHPC